MRLYFAGQMKLKPLVFRIDYHVTLVWFLLTWEFSTVQYDIKLCTLIQIRGDLHVAQQFLTWHKTVFTVILLHLADLIVVLQSIHTSIAMLMDS